MSNKNDMDLFFDPPNKSKYDEKYALDRIKKENMPNDERIPRKHKVEQQLADNDKALDAVAKMVWLLEKGLIDEKTIDVLNDQYTRHTGETKLAEDINSDIDLYDWKV